MKSYQFWYAYLLELESFNVEKSFVSLGESGALIESWSLIINNDQSEIMLSLTKLCLM